MILPGCPLSQAFAAGCDWLQALMMGTGFLCVMWILGEAWLRAALGLHYPSLATPEKKKRETLISPAFD